ncbi:replication protein [Streptococcus mitis]|uniref:Replication protein n=1 Tax=Streptococcus mitis TaxID=28037 RepID=A0A150NGI4_STRMT|nr:replication protein [Streptococcus mitis]
MANEVVKHHNDLNTVIMRKWTAEEMNFFFSILAKARDKGTSELVFDKYQLAELANYSIQHNKRFYDTMDNLANHISQLRYIERTSNSVEYMPLFTRFKVEWEKDLSDMQATVAVSPHFEYILNKLSANFTQYELQEFTSIRSTYAKTAYRLLKQWRTVGRKEFKKDEFKLLMDTPEYYQVSDIDRLVIKPIKKQLSPYFAGLKVKKIKSNKRGNPVLGYEFTWQKEVTEAYDPHKYDKPKNTPKKPSKKAAKKSNVPKWSKSDYVNELSEEFIEKLIETQKELGIYGTPEAEAELAQRREEIEKKRAELESKKAELLKRLEGKDKSKSSEPDVVPGQTDIYDFLGDDEK